MDAHHSTLQYRLLVRPLLSLPPHRPLPLCSSILCLVLFCVAESRCGLGERRRLICQEWCRVAVCRNRMSGLSHQRYESRLRTGVKRRKLATSCSNTHTPTHTQLTHTHHTHTAAAASGRGLVFGGGGGRGGSGDVPNCVLSQRKCLSVERAWQASRRRLHSEIDTRLAG